MLAFFVRGGLIPGRTHFRGLVEVVPTMMLCAELFVPPSCCSLSCCTPLAFSGPAFFAFRSRRAMACLEQRGCSIIKPWVQPTVMRQKKCRAGNRRNRRTTIWKPFMCKDLPFVRPPKQMSPLAACMFVGSIPWVAPTARRRHRFTVRRWRRL
jgi:hypothetical protein